MADDLTDKGAQDRARINVNEKYELKHWSKRFGVSPERLREAVNKVGPAVSEVERELGGQERGVPGRDTSSQ